MLHFLFLICSFFALVFFLLNRSLIYPLSQLYGDSMTLGSGGSSVVGNFFSLFYHNFIVWQLDYLILFNLIYLLTICWVMLLVLVLGAILFCICFRFVLFCLSTAYLMYWQLCFFFICGIEFRFFVYLLRLIVSLVCLLLDYLWCSNTCLIQ